MAGCVVLPILVSTVPSRALSSSQVASTPCTILLPGGGGVETPGQQCQENNWLYKMKVIDNHT